MVVLNQSKSGKSNGKLFAGWYKTLLRVCITWRTLYTPLMGWGVLFTCFINVYVSPKFHYLHTECSRIRQCQCFPLHWHCTDPCSRKMTALQMFVYMGNLSRASTWRHRPTRYPNVAHLIRAILTIWEVIVSGHQFVHWRWSQYLMVIRFIDWLILRHGCTRVIAALISPLWRQSLPHPGDGQDTGWGEFSWKCHPISSNHSLFMPKLHHRNEWGPALFTCVYACRGKINVTMTTLHRAVFDLIRRCSVLIQDICPVFSQRVCKVLVFYERRIGKYP